MISITVMTAIQACLMVTPDASEERAGRKPDDGGGDDRRQQDRGPGSQRLERPDGGIGLGAIEGDRDRIVQARPRDFRLADRRPPEDASRR